MHGLSAQMRRIGLGLMAAVLLATGLLLGVSSRPHDVEAQPAPIPLNALCVHGYTRIVSAPTPFTGTICPPVHFALLIPDSFPFTLYANPATGVVLFPTTPPPFGYVPIPLPAAGNLPLCLNFFTNSLRFTSHCANVQVVLIAEITPSANPDGLYTIPITVTLNEPAPGLLANDDLGLPAAEIVSFGGGSLAGDASTNPANTTLGGGLAGGDLSVNADGSFSLVNPTIPGDYSFDYRLENAAGFDDATVTLQVQQAPTALADGLYTTLENVTLNVTATDPDYLLDNDTLGFPNAAIVSFGGGSLGGAVTTNDAGEPVALAGGTLTVNANGSFELLNPTTGGDYTFVYRLENAAGFDDATVTLQVQRSPDAVNDGPYSMTVNTTLTVLSSAPNDLLDNDDSGFPPTDIDSFGGGDAPGAVTTNAPGIGVPFAGGTLLINSDGGFQLASPTLTGSFTFDYRLENAAGFDDATVTIEVQGPPDAVDDGPAVDSAPGDLFHTAFDTTLDSTLTAGDDNLLSNDDLGFPEGAIVSFGGGDLGGTVTSNAAGDTAPIIDQPSGSLTVNPNGSFVFVPTAGFTGEFSFQYRLENDAGSDDATVTIAVGVRPEALDDTYIPTVLGNVSINTTTSTDFSVLANDTGDDLDFTATSLASSQGGDVVLAAGGTFSYDPPAGYEGADSFTYQIDNGFNDPQTGTVSLTVDGMLWFIDIDDPTADGDGRLSDPFNCLVGTGCFDPVASDEAGDSIFLASGAYTGGVTLLDNQLFIGEGATEDLSTVTVLTPPADSPSLPGTNGTRPQLTTSNADALTLGSTNTVRGMNVGDTGTGIGILGSDFVMLTLSEVTISGTGQAVNLVNGTVDATFTSLASTSSVSQGVDLNALSGAFTVTGTTDLDNSSGDGLNIQDSPATFAFQGNLTVDGAAFNGIHIGGATTGAVTLSSIDLDTIGVVGLGLTNLTSAVSVNGGSIGATNDPNSNAVDIDGGSANVTVAATVSKTTAGEVVEVTGRTGGTVTLSNTLSCTSGCTGVNVSNNTSGSTTFSGSVTTDTGANTAVSLTTNSGHTVTFSGGLDIATTSGVGFNATGGGTVEVLNGGVTNSVTSTTGSAINVASVVIGSGNLNFNSVSADGASTAVLLNNTGTAGGLKIGAGGTVIPDGGTIQNVTTGFSLTLTSNVSINYMRIRDVTGDAILGDRLTDGSNGIESTFEVTHSEFLDIGTNAATDEVFDFRTNDGAGTFNVTGSIVLDNVVVDEDVPGARNGFAGNGLFVVNNVSTLAISVTNSAFRHTPNTGDTALNISARGTNTTNVTVTDSEATLVRGEMLSVISEGADATADVNFLRNLVQGANTGGDSIGSGVRVAVNMGASATFDINDNDAVNGGGFLDLFGDPIEVSLNDDGTNAGGSLEGRINNNLVEDSVDRSIVVFFDGDSIGMTGTTFTGVIEIDGNDIRRTGSPLGGALSAIEVSIRDSNPAADDSQVDLTFSDNLIGAGAGNAVIADNGIFLNVFNTNADVNVLIDSTDVVQTAAALANALHVRSRENATVNLTVLNSSFNTPSDDEIQLRTEDAGSTLNANLGGLSPDLTVNVLGGGSGSLRLNELAGNLNVLQEAAGAGANTVTTRNGVPAGNITLDATTPNFTSGVVPTLPALPTNP